MNSGMRRRDFVRTAAVAGAGLAAGALPDSKARAQGEPKPKPGPQGAPEARSGKRPNLLFVFSDQQSWDMLGCYGNPAAITPHLDRFAGEGLRFTHTFVNAPVCTPCRGMIVSGKHPLHNGAFENDFPICPAAGPHFGDVLENAGYRTGWVGKWHLLGGDRVRPVPDGPLRGGFDTFLSDNCTTEFRAGHAYWWDENGQKRIFDKWQPEGQTDQAIEFMKEASADEDQPFALFLSWHPPHDHGLMAPQPPRYYDYRHVPDEHKAAHAGREVALRPGVDRDDPLRQESTRDHYAMCTGVDACFGRLMEALKDMDLDENTLVVFTSDHGDMLGKFPTSPPKRPIHDISSRVPMLMRQPGVLPAGEDREVLFGTLDWMPTLLGMLDIDVPEGLHGVDLSETVAEGGEGPVDSIPMFMIGWPTFRGVVTREWTYSMGPPANKPGGRNEFNCVLFDRERDPHQLHNLFDDPDHAELSKTLEAKTRAWMDRFEDPFITLPDLTKRRTINQWRMPEGDPMSWPTPIDVFHGRA